MDLDFFIIIMFKRMKTLSKQLASSAYSTGTSDYYFQNNIKHKYITEKERK